MPVPLNIQAEDTVTIVNEAELACLICSLDELGSLSKLIGGCKTVKTLVVMDLPSELDSDTQALLTEVGHPRRCRRVYPTDMIGHHILSLLCMPGWP